MAFLRPIAAWSASGKHTSRYALFVVLLACASGAFVGYSSLTQGAGVICYLYHPQAPLPDGFGAPYNVFSTAKEMLVRVTCSNNSATVEAGGGATNQYVYKTGYEWRGGQWKTIAFTGSSVAAGSVWLKGKGTSNLSRTAVEMDGKNYVVGYVCQYLNNAWKCGCRDSACTTAMWQIQAFTRPDTSMPDVLSGSNELTVAYPSKSFAAPGATVTLLGSGFSTVAPGNTILFGSRSIPGVRALNKTNLSFTVPADATPGLTSIKVQNEKGTTATGTQIMITRPGAVAPTVTSISPASGGFNTRVTIRGTGFTPTDNYVMTSYGMVSGIPSQNGTTLSFDVRPFPDFPMLWDGSTTTAMSGTTFTAHMYVMNTGGVSEQSALFTVQIP